MFMTATLGAAGGRRFSDPARSLPPRPDARLRDGCTAANPYRCPEAVREARTRRGRVSTFATQLGIASTAGWERARYADGVSPTSSLNRELNDPSEVQPTAMQ